MLKLIRLKDDEFVLILRAELVHGSSRAIFNKLVEIGLAPRAITTLFSGVQVLDAALLN